MPATGLQQVDHRRHERAQLEPRQTGPHGVVDLKPGAIEIAPMVEPRMAKQGRQIGRRARSDDRDDLTWGAESGHETLAIVER